MELPLAMITLWTIRPEDFGATFEKRRLGMPAGKSPRHAQNERKKTLSKTHYALSPHTHVVNHLINRLHCFYRITTLSPKWLIVPKSDIKKQFTTITTDHFDELHGMVNRWLKNTIFRGECPRTPLPPVWRTIFLTLPLYAIVHTNHFEVLHDMVHQMYNKYIFKKITLN